MADHSDLLTTELYSTILSRIDGRLDDTAKAFDPANITHTNPQTNTVRWTSASNKWQKYDGSSWVDLTATYAIAISGNAGTATTLATARTINGVSFNGSANITVTANTGSAVTFNNGGSGAASGTTFNGSAAQTISYNTVGAPSTAGTGATGTWAISISGNAATATVAGTAGSAFAQTLLDDTSQADARATLDAASTAQATTSPRSTTATTLVAADTGKTVALTAGITIPANIFAAGAVVSLYNDSAASVTITQGGSLTLRAAGSTTTGNRTLVARGLCSVWFNSTTEAIIAGAGVT
jgi:hypothetical protein